MSAKEIIAQIDAMAPAERKAVFDYVYQITEAQVPDTFRRSIEHMLADKGVDMETALNQVPPSRR